MSNYTPEELERAAEWLRFGAATLRQQAGRVDAEVWLVQDWKWCPKCGGRWGVTAQCECCSFNAALAQNTQASHIPSHAKKVGDETYAWQGDAQNTQGEAEGVAEIFDALPYCSERTTFTFSRDKLQALLRHAERARVPDGLVRKALTIASNMRTADWLEAGGTVREQDQLADYLAAAPSQRAEVK